ncbi:hypothetical protein [Pyxidicoccus trucidator]|uniref:hypothetical protein n=1 Tax=Pyxidicoccus trucidator TaxID=2709662 RepID=UPI0013DCE99B|nr:hypothetical protein [Pyxidicoccus trucidator]
MLRLVVDADSAERQVEVRRRPRPWPRALMRAESLREENLRLSQEMESLREENLRLRLAMAPLLSPPSGPVGLGKLFEDGPLNTADLVVRRIELTLARLPAQSLRIRAAWTYRLGAQAALVLEDTERTGARVLSAWVDVRLARATGGTSRWERKHFGTRFVDPSC